MTKQHDQHDGLSAFEEALAALRPRVDSLNRDRLMFLAGQASVRPREEGAPDGADGMLGAASGLSTSALPTAGQARRNGTSSHRWGWPTAFAAVSTIAAGLMVALFVRPPQVVERIVEVPAGPPAAAVARGDRHDGDAHLHKRTAWVPRPTAEWPSGWMTFVLGSFGNSRSMPLASTDASSHKRLRDVVLSGGLNAWPTPIATPAGGSRVSPRSRPTSQRELLEEFLKAPDNHRPAPPDCSLESPSRPGEKP